MAGTTREGVANEGSMKSNYQKSLAEYVIENSRRGQTVQISEHDFFEFLHNTEVTAVDYNTLIAIRDGYIDTYCGRKIQIR